MKRISTLPVVLLIVAVVAALGWIAYTVLSPNGPADVPSTPRSNTATMPPQEEPLTPDALSASAPKTDPVRQEETRETSAEPKVRAADEIGPPGKIVGKVVSPSGEAIAGAEIELATGPALGVTLPGLMTSTGLSVRTDAGGGFALEPVEPSDDYIVLASHPDFGDAPAAGIVVHAGQTVDIGRLQLQIGVHVQGTVTANGRPLAQAVVSLSNQMEKLRRFQPNLPKQADLEPLQINCSTDEQGHYEFTAVPVDTFELTARAEGFCRMTKSSQSFLSSPKDHTIDFELTPAATIAGRVIDADKNAIHDAKITATVANQNFRCEAEAASDANGRFALQELAEGQYFLNAECEGFSPANKAQVEAGSSDIELMLQPQGSVLGIVLNEATGDPLSEFELSVLQSLNGRSPVSTRIRQRFHDTNGRFELKNLDPGMYVLQATVVGFAESLSDEFQIGRGQPTSGVKVLVNKGGTVIGSTVDPNGAPIPNALVLLRQNKMKDSPVNDIFRGFTAGDPEKKVKSDLEGKFRIELIVPGSYQIAVRHPQFAQFELNDVEVVKNHENGVGALALRRGAKIIGHLFDMDGKPLAGAQLVALSSAQDYRQARSDNEGSYQLLSLPPGEYTLTINNFPSATRMNPIEMIMIAKTSAQKATLNDGDVQTIDLKLTPLKGGGSK